MSVYSPEAFAARVNYAAQRIAVFVRTNCYVSSRHFDTCFEMHDGDAVIAALHLRAKKNPTLAAGLAEFFTGQANTEAVAKYGHMTARQLSVVAADLRRAARVAP